MSNILITGGTGFIGEELRSRLLKEGHHLAIVTRSPQKYEDESAKNQRFISWEDDLVPEMNTADAVINLVGENVFAIRWTPEKKQRIMDSRVENTRKLVDAMREADSRPSVLVSASGSNVYGDRGDDILDESEPPADNFFAEVCNRWEAEALKAEELGVRVVITRTGMVLGGDGGALEKMVPAFKLGVGGPVGGGDQYISWIHRDDFCSLMEYAIQNEELSGVCNTSSPNPVTMNEFSSTLGSVLNRPSFFKVPEFALDLVMGEVAGIVTASIRMQPKKLQVSGFEFRFEELTEALADIL